MKVSRLNSIEQYVISRETVSIDVMARPRAAVATGHKS